MRGGRKGSMQLSIEAIIILVIAMVLLGLGITFIQTFFKTGTDKLLEPFDAIEFGCDPSPNNPITTSPSNVEVKSGNELRVKMCVYSKVVAVDADLRIEGCTSTAPGVGTSMMPELLTQPQSIARTEIGGFNTILTASDASQGSLPVGTYICTIEAVTAAAEVLGTKQVTISVI